MVVELIPWSEASPPEEHALRERLARDGFDAFLWSDAPGARYSPHTHDHDESRWVVRGEITFGIDGRSYRLGPGDRLMLPQGTVHEAVAGADGATYWIGEREETG